MNANVMWRYTNVETLVSRAMFKVVYDLQHTKRPLGLDQRVHLCSLIWAFSVC